MATVKPLVAGPAQFQQLQTGDTLLAPAVNRGNGFISWTGEATVTPATSVALVDSTGALLSPTKTYKVAACNIDSSAQRGAVALFVGNGSTFTLKTVYEQGTSSSNVQLYLNSGVPSVSVYGGSGSYRIPYIIDEVPNFGQGLSEFGILQRLLDAPSDGKEYVRKNGMWVETTGGGGGSMTYRKQATFTSSGTFTLPATAMPSVDYDIVAGGGAGGGAANSGGGGGGERLQGVATMVPGSSYAVTVGAGGAGVSDSTGGNGGNSSIAGVATARGGKGGSSTQGGLAGDGTVGPNLRTTLVASTSAGGGAPTTSGSGTCHGGIGLNGLCSGGGAGSYSQPAGLGGPGAGNGSTDTGTPTAATAPGCGGGGASNIGSSGGNGFRGQVTIIYWDTVS